MVRLITWLLIATLVVVAVSSALGAGPERIRALLLFPLAFGALVGSALAISARESGVRSRWLVSVLSCVLVCGGLLVVAREAYGELVALARERVREDSTRLLGLRMLEDQAAGDPTFVKQYLELRMAVEPKFDDYLMGRVSALGIWRSPWPALVWGIEVFLGTVAGGWLSWRIMGRGNVAETGDRRSVDPEMTGVQDSGDGGES